MKLEKKLNRQVGKLIHNKTLINNGDKILIALSGGKDSWTLCYFLQEFQKKAPIQFDIQVCTLDVHFSKSQKNLLQESVSALNLPYVIYPNKIIDIIQQKRRKDSSYCSFCARLRRAYLYEAAQKYNCNKVALGHHLDDAIETYLLNILFQGKTIGMPAKLSSTSAKGLEIIRPLLYCLESEIIEFSDAKAFPIIKCNCEDTIKTESKRPYLKSLLNQLEKENQGLKQTILTSMQNVIPSHIF